MSQQTNKPTEDTAAQLRELWTMTYHVYVAGYFAPNGNYVGRPPAQYEAQLARLDNWWGLVDELEK